MHINVTVDDATAHAKLQELRHRAGTLRPALLAIAEDFHAEEADLFAGRAHWKPLDPAWARRKALLGFGGRTLVLRGHLEESLTGTGSKWSVQEISDNELLVGTKDPVAHLHQAGTKKMPSRQPVRTTRETQRRWATMLHDWLVDGVD